MLRTLSNWQYLAIHCKPSFVSPGQQLDLLWSARPFVARRKVAPSQVASVLAERKRKEKSPEGSSRLDVLRTLAREIGLVAVAAQDGCLCHVVGRAHIPCARRRSSDAPAAD